MNDIKKTKIKKLLISIPGITLGVLFITGGLVGMTFALMSSLTIVPLIGTLIFLGGSIFCGIASLLSNIKRLQTLNSKHHKTDERFNGVMTILHGIGLLMLAAGAPLMTPAYVLLTALLSIASAFVGLSFIALGIIELSKKPNSLQISRNEVLKEDETFTYSNELNNEKTNTYTYLFQKENTITTNKKLSSEIHESQQKNFVVVNSSP